MANTVIQIKRSTTTTAPSAGSLSAAEPAYSYLSDKLFLGSSDGTQVIEIGGRYYINVAIQAYDTANTANDRAVAAFVAANNALASSGGPAFDKANSANIIASQAFDKANSANLLAYNTGIGANAFAAATVAGANTAVGAGANAFASATIAGANTAVGAGANNYLLAVIAGANTAVGGGANAYMIAVQNGSNTAIGGGANAFTSATVAGANTAVGAGANAFTSATVAGANTAVGAGANAFAAVTIAGANTAVGAGANAYSDSTFVKLTAPNQTITGNLSISGSLILSGNTYKVDANTLVVQDPLIFLAGNNKTSDIVDIGFVGVYSNATSVNVYTGLFRDATVKEYYLFQNYSAEPTTNDIDPAGNNFTLSVLNAAIRTSNLNLVGMNAAVWITGAYDKANAANSLAFNTGVGANAFAAATIAGANTAVGGGANAFTSATVSGANNFFTATIAGANTAVGAGANAFTSATIAGANTAVGAGANNYLLAVIAGANTAVGGGANAYMIAVQNGSNTAIGAGANPFTSATVAGANTAVGGGANAFTSATVAGANTAVGAGANSYAALVGAAANTNASNASYISTGTLAVAYGGTGRTTLANNGVLFGNTTSDIRVTAAGTEGNVLQVNNQGTPFFGMLDGGSF